MNSESLGLADQAARERAIKPELSILLQAPAGSGKTEVLAQRFLALLTTVEQPEHILALTFTRKAAAEMRQRLIEALQSAQLQTESPSTEPELSRWRLAQAVLARDQALHWDLLNASHRLRLLTIDSLCATLVKQSILQVPVADYSISPQSWQLYIEAVYRVLYEAKPQSWSAALERLLRYFNTDYGYFAKILAGLLGRRDLWLDQVSTIQTGLTERRFSQSSVIAWFDQQLGAIGDHLVAQLQACLTPSLWNELWSLVCFAQAQLGQHDLAEQASITLDESQLIHWQTLAELVLTQDGELRARFDRRQGLPATAKLQKAAMTACIEQLNLLEQRGTLLIWLDLAQYCANEYQADPAHSFSFDLFAVAIACEHALEQVFAERNQIDYPGLAKGALAALGDGELTPSELLLRLDYHIQHLLVDEFQDTSNSQLQLLEALTSGWQSFDGRSVFLVGDPMQSIYSFRAADVHLFFQVQQQGLGALEVEFLQLRRNFRSTPSMIAAADRLLSPLFPSEPDPLFNQVSFAKALAGRKEQTSCKPLDGQVFTNATDEHMWLITQIKALVLTPKQRLAILVRKKKQVPALTQLLREHQLRYTAVDLDPLWNFSEIRDLYHLASWLFGVPTQLDLLALSRGPWVGASLVELAIISAHFEQDRSFATDPDGLGKARARRLRALLQSCANARGLSGATPTEQLRAVWFACLGPELSSAEQQQRLHLFWQIMDEVTEQGQLQLHALRERLETAQTSVVDPLACIEIMTVHRAKGLEFYAVMVPGIQEFVPKDQDEGMVRILQYQLPAEPSNLLFAMNQSSDQRHSAPTSTLQKNQRVSSLLKRIRGQREQAEAVRLFYVAVTRAEQRIFLSATVSSKNDELRKPKRGLVNAIWDSLHPNAPTAQSQQTTAQIGPYTALADSTVLDCIAALEWHRPLRDHERHLTPASQWADYWLPQLAKTQQQLSASRLGQLVHAWFEAIDCEQLAVHDWRDWLAQLIGCWQWSGPKVELEQLKERSQAIINQCRADPLLPWLIQPRTLQWRETIWHTGSPGASQALRPDLAFWDEASQRLWIIDFKTSVELAEQPSMASIVAAFGQQLDSYGTLFRAQGYSAITRAVYLANGLPGKRWWQLP